MKQNYYRIEKLATYRTLAILKLQFPKLCMFNVEWLHLLLLYPHKCQIPIHALDLLELFATDY